MTFDVFLMMLLIVSALTGLATEAIKMWLKEHKIRYYANALAGYVAVMLSITVGTAYIILSGATINARITVYFIALVFLSWLAAMVGYDKVIQTITQLRVKNKMEV